MIAANIKKNPDAMIRQLELDFSGVVDADEKQRRTFWEWLMNTGKVIASKTAKHPAWYAAMRERAVKLAKAVKAACLKLF